MKSCSKCSIKKEYSEFGLSSKEKDGMQYHCKKCQKEYRKNNKQLISKNGKIYNTKNKKDRIVKSKVYYENNKDYISKRNSLYRKNNRSKINALTAKRRSSKQYATPSWSELDKITILYKKAKWLESLTGLKYHVDHIVPINGINVSGLHVWENLQILESSINIKKGNKYE